MRLCRLLYVTGNYFFEGFALIGYELMLAGYIWAFPRIKMQLENSDFCLLNEEDERSTKLKGGFHYGMNRKGTVYGLPRPLLNHGIHRCNPHPIPNAGQS